MFAHKVAVKAATPGTSIIPYMSDSKSFTAALIKIEKQQEEKKLKANTVHILKKTSHE